MDISYYQPGTPAPWHPGTMAPWHQSLGRLGLLTGLGGAKEDPSPLYTTVGHYVKLLWICPMAFCLAAPFSECGLFPFAASPFLPPFLQQLAMAKKQGKDCNWSRWPSSYHLSTFVLSPFQFQETPRHLFVIQQYLFFIRTLRYLPNFCGKV